MDSLGDPRDPSKWSAEDLVTMGFVNTPELAELLDDTPKLADMTWTDTTRSWSPADSPRCSPSARARISRQRSDQSYEAEKPTAIYCHGTAAMVDLKLSDG